MTLSGSRVLQFLSRGFTTALRWLLLGLGMLCRVLLLAWGALAIRYSNLPWPWLRFSLAAAFLVFGVWALWFSRRPRSYTAFVAIYGILLVWWMSIRPSNNRSWRKEVAVMPRAVIDGDRVRITGCRDFEWRSVDDFTVRYEEREVLLSHLTSVDFFISYWMPGPVAHTFVSFNFDNAPPLSISIETRPEEGEGFDPIASMFKQFELIYVVGSERDIVGVRTHFRHEEVFLYPLRIPPEAGRRLLLAYLERINQLADKPEFYHLLSNNCSLNIVRYANVAGREGGFELDHLLNGFFDRYLYRTGLVDRSLPFAELRRRAHINDAANAADKSTDFSWRIRALQGVKQ
jgi:hypothetical protein